MKICRNVSVLVLTLLIAFLSFGCGGSDSPAPAPPSPQPIATTGGATSVTTDNAVLNGVVNPNGLDTDAWFEISTNSSLTPVDNTTTTQAVGSDNTNHSVSQTVTDLSPGTTYYFRIVAQSSAGTVNGDIESFTTVPPPGPPSVQTNDAINVSTGSATLRGSVNPNGLDTDAWFEWGIDNTFTVFDNTSVQEIVSGRSPVSVNAQITGLSDNTTYYFRLVAVNSAGDTVGASQDFTTLPSPGPTADAGLDQQVFWLGAFGANEVTLDGTGSLPAVGDITYLWEQESGPPVTLIGDTSATPTFTAPVITYADSYPTDPSKKLTFKLTVTDDSNFSGTDTVDVTVKYAYEDDFSTDTTGTYTTSGDGTLTYDSNAARVEAGPGETLFFEHDIGFPGLYLRPFQGVFSLGYSPVRTGSGGGVDIRFGEVYDNVYIRISTIDNVVEKRFATQQVSVPFNPTVTAGENYWIRIAFTGDNVVVNFGQQAPVVLQSDLNIPVEYFWVDTWNQDVYYDDIVLRELN